MGTAFQGPWSPITNQIILDHVLYAISALHLSSSKLAGYDFVKLWKNSGIHPIAAATAMIALPFLIRFFYWQSEQKELLNLY